MKQGLRELKVDKKKESKVEITYIAKVGFINTFNFNFSFSILPNIISDNTPILFL